MKTFLILMVIAVSMGLIGCAQGTVEKTEPAENGQAKENGSEMKEGTIQSKESQAALTPDAALKLLMDGNKRYVENKSANISSYRTQAAKTAEGQFPFATILSCVDSRVAAEHIFDLNNGDAFNGRVAGNVASTEMLGSFEFTTKLAGSKVIMVLGHTSCGAVKGACDNAKLGNLTALLGKIDPAVNAISKDWADGEKNSKNDKFVQAVSVENVKRVKADILERSEVIKKLVDDGEVKLVGAMYDISTGKVSLIES